MTNSKQKLYDMTEDGGIRFVSKRRAGEVRIPNYIYDIWMPLLGADALGVYALYCRMEMEGYVKKLRLKDIANVCRIGTIKLDKVNQDLEKCGFIKVTKPQGADRLRHWTTKIEILDPPIVVSSELIEELAPKDGYKVLANWLVRESRESQNQSPGIPESISGSRIQDFMEVPESISMIESLELNPLSVEGGDCSKLVCRDYLADVVTHEQGQENVSAPDGFQQHFGYRDEFLNTYNKLTGDTPNQAVKDAIIALAHDPGADVSLWEKSTREALMNWSGHTRIPPASRSIEIYQCGGSYEKWRQWKWPEGNGGGQVDSDELYRKALTRLERDGLIEMRVDETTSKGWLYWIGTSELVTKEDAIKRAGVR